MTDYLRLAQERAPVEQDEQDNPYLPMAREQQGLQQNRVRTILETALKDNPDIAAERLKISQQSGVPLRIVERNLDELRVKEQARMLDLASMASESPVLYRQLTDPTFATTSVDDLDTLKNIERTMGRGLAYVMGADGKGGLPADAAGAAKTIGLGATVGIGKMAFDMAAVVNDLIGWDAGAAGARAQANRAQDAMDAYGFQGGSSTRDAVKSGLQSAGTNLALLPLGLVRGLWATANQAASAVAGVMAAGVGADAFNRAREQGKNEFQAGVYAIPEATFEFVFERIPASKLFGDIAANTGLLKMLGRQTVSEGWTEQVTTLAQDFNEWMNLNPEKTLGEFIAERPEAAYQTFVATLVGVGVQTSTIQGINKIVEKVSNQQLQFELDRFNEQMKLASQSMLRQRSPEQFRAHIQRVVEENPETQQEIFVDGQVLNQLPQELLAQLPESVREQIDAAVQTNSPVSIPMADVLTVAPGTPLEQILNDNARMTPDGVSRIEAQQAGEQAREFIQQESERVLQQAADQDAWQQSTLAVKQTILDQLNQVGRHSADVNDAYATLQMHFFSTMAARLGITSQEMYDRFTLKVAGQSQGGQVLSQVLPDFAAMQAKIDRQRMLNEQRPEGSMLRNVGERTLARLTAEYEAALQTAAPVLEKLQGTKITGTNGQPLVVYHGGGTAIAESGKFRRKEGGRAVWFSSSEVAGTYAGEAEGGTVYPVYLDAKNPLEFDASGATWQQLEFEGQRLSTDDLADIAEQRGHDALIIRNLRDENTDDGGQDAADHFAVFKPEQVVSATSGETLAQFNRGTFDPADANVLNQDERDLIVAHNLTAENLRAAMEIGGLAAPSLAITKVDSPIQGFGEITLIGDTALATPSAKNPVFDADVYSPRFPDVKVKVDEKKVKAVLQPLMDAAKDAGLPARRPDSAIEQMQRNRLASAIGDMGYDTGLRLGFANAVLGKNLTVPTREVAPPPVAKAGAPIIEQSPLKELLPTLNVGELTPETAGDLGQKVYAALVNKTLADLDAERKGAPQERFEMAMELVNRRIRLFAETEIEQGSKEFEPEKVGKMTDKGLYALYNLVRNAPKVEPQSGPRTEVDSQALNELLDAQAPREQFDAWLREQLRPAMGERRVVTDSGRTAPFTLDNIVKAMTRKVRDAEGFNYGLGNARSKGATKFKSLRQIQGQRDRVVSKDDFEAARKEIDAEFAELAREVTPFQKYERESAFELLAEAIGNSYSVPMARALEDAALVDVPADLQKRIAEFAGALVGAPTEYFEAKPQRAVSINEFRGAAIPANTPADVREALTAQGLELVEYEKGNEQSRAQAVRQLSKQLNAGTGDVLFQGPRATFNPQTLLVTLNENADLSSFLHESGHFFLEVMADLASQPNAPQQIVDDMAATLKWFGVPDLATWNGYTLDQKRQYHERWAESFEQYLLEGRAPTADLQPLFRRFRSWMINVYKSLTEFMRSRNLKVSDDIRQVFDRMIATDDQIAQAEEAAGMLPDFDATNEAIEKLQARSLRDLKWAVNARNKAIKALQKQAAELRKGVEAEVRAEVEATPEVRAKRALDALRKSTPESKAALAEWKAQRQAAYDKAAEDIGAQLLATEGAGLKGLDKGQFLAKNKRRIANEAEAVALKWERDNPKPERTLVGSEVEVATVADSFGYPSVDAMLQAIDAYGPIDAAIEGITDQRMLERHGDLVDQRAIEEAATQAVHNEARAKSLATELKAQSEMLNPRQDTGRTNAQGRPITVNAIVKAAKEFAENLASRRRIKDLKNATHQHRAAEARAGKRWQEATAKGETQVAVQAKRDQTLNNYTVKALQDAQAEAKKIIEFFRKVTTGNNEKLVKGGRDPDVVNAMRAILAAYDVAPRLEKSALEYMEVVSRNDPVMYGALKPSVDAALFNAKPLSEMTMEELRGLNDELRGMWDLAKRSRQSEIDGNLVDREELEDELLARMETIGIPLEVPGERGSITAKEELGIKVQFVKAFLTRVEQWAERLDGKFGGPFLRYVFQPVKEAADRYRADRVKYRDRFTKLVEGIAPTLRRGPIAAPELGYTFGNARDSGVAELLHAILHTGNESNKRKLLLGRKWATENADGTLDTSRWDAFVQRMIDEGVIGKVHYDFAQGVWDLLEETKPLAQQAHRTVFGRYFAEVTADAFVTPFGTYRGGYVPAQTDTRLVQDRLLNEMAEAENESMSYSFPAAPSGFTKARVEYNRPLLLDLRVLAQHMDKVLLFGHMQPAVNDVRRLLTSKRVAYALNRIDPGAYAGMLLPWLNRSARQIVETPIPGDRGVSRLLGASRSRAGMALMFANLSNTFQQITGFSLAAVKVKPNLMLKSTAEFARNPRQMQRTVAGLSAFMKDRMLNEVSAMNDVVEQILIDPTLLERGRAWTNRHAYFMQAAVDNTMSPIIWTAAYNQALEEGQNATDAVRFADGVIRQTQGTTLPEDISRFESGPPTARIFTQFVSYFNMMVNTNATAVKQIADEVGLKKGAGKLLYVALAGLLVPIWVAEAIAHAMRGGPEDEDDDGYLDDWLMAVFGIGTLRGLVAQIPVVAQAGQLVINRFNDNPADDKFSLSPAVSLLESAVSSPFSVYNAIIEDGSKQKAVRDVASAATMATGLPLFALGRPLGYLAGVADDRIEPTGPADFARGLVTGTASPESRVP